MTIEATIATAVASALAEPLEALDARLGALAEAVTHPVPEPLLDRRCAAAWAGCSTRQVDAWLADGCPCIRLGGPGGSPRMRASELLGWLRARTEDGHG